LVDRGVDDLIAVVGEWDVWAISLEQVLVDMKAFPEGFVCRLQTTHGVLLLVRIQALVVHAPTSQSDAKIARFGHEDALRDETVQIHVGIQ